MCSLVASSAGCTDKSTSEVTRTRLCWRVSRRSAGRGPFCGHNGRGGAGVEMATRALHQDPKSIKTRGTTIFRDQTPKATTNIQPKKRDRTIVIGQVRGKSRFTHTKIGTIAKGGTTKNKIAVKTNLIPPTQNNRRYKAKTIGEIRRPQLTPVPVPPGAKSVSRTILARGLSPCSGATLEDGRVSPSSISTSSLRSAPQISSAVTQSLSSPRSSYSLVLICSQTNVSSSWPNSPDSTMSLMRRLNTPGEWEIVAIPSSTSSSRNFFRSSIS